MSLTERQKEYLEAWNDVKKFPTIADIAEHFGVLPKSVSRRIAAVREAGHKVLDRKEIAKLERQNSEIISEEVSSDMSYEELVEDRCTRFAKKMAHEEATKRINMRIPIEGPYAIVFLGDPHVDDNGCDWPALRKHMDLINETEGMYAVNVGDTTNNWVGRLARLYADQSTTANEAWILAEGFVRELKDKWLYILGGNHDAWSGAADPLKWISKAINVLYSTDQAKVKLNQGKNHILINSRHDFKGYSMWNPAHGVGRAIQQGDVDHVTVCGHRHVSGYMVLKSPEGRICHGMQVASYKVIDQYAKTLGLRDQNVSPATAIIVDHTYKENDPGMITVMHSIEEAAEFLEFKRARWKKLNNNNKPKK